MDVDVVPRIVVDATCEMARELLDADRTAAFAGAGRSVHDDRDRGELKQHPIQQERHAAEYLACRAGDAGEVRRAGEGRERSGAAGEGVRVALPRLLPWWD